MPGDLFTPVVNLCAVDQRRTVIRSSPEVTGRGVGFNTVIETAQKAGYKGDLPRSPDLYAGRFRAPLSHAVNALYLIGNDGRNVQISSVRQVGTTKKNLVMVNAPSPEESRREILPRESAHLVAALPPFRYDERSRKTSVNVRLPENTGHFSAVMGRYFTVFVWVGFDEPDEAVYKRRALPPHWRRPPPRWPGKCMTGRRKTAAKPSGSAGRRKLLRSRTPDGIQFSINRIS